MKYLMIAVLCLLSIRTIAQHNTPPKKATKIIVLIRDTANTLLDKVTRTLFDFGYTIENKDEKLKLLSTKEKSSKIYSTLTKLRASINDTSIVFAGDLALGFDVALFGVRDHQPSYSEIYYGGAKKSPLREAWNELDAIAHKFGDNIIYSK